MKEIVQSAGRISRLQQFMLDNLVTLEKVPGVNIDKSGLVKKDTNTPDDLLGPKTTGSIQSILIAAGINVESEYDKAAQTKLAEFLEQNGIEAEQASLFAQNADNLINDKDLSPLYKQSAKASALINKNEKAGEKPAPKKKPDPDEGVIMVAEKESKETSPSKEEPDPDEGLIMMAKAPPNANVKELQGFLFKNQKNLTAIPGVSDFNKGNKNGILDENTANALNSIAVAALFESDVKESQISGEYNEHTKPIIAAFLANKGLDSDSVEKFIDASQIISKGSRPGSIGILKGVYEQNATIDTKGIVAFLKAMDKPQEKQQEILLAAVSQKSPDEISTPFRDAMYIQSRDAAIYTLADIEHMEKNNPDTDQIGVIASVRSEYEQRLNQSEEYQYLMDGIEAKRKRLGEIYPEIKQTIQDTMKTAKLIDLMRAGKADFKEDDVKDVELEFSAVIDGEKHFFKMNLNDFENRDFKDSNLPRNKKFFNDQDIKAMKASIQTAFINMRDTCAAISDIPINFTAVADGKEQEFSLSLRQIREHDFEGFHFWERMDIKAIEQAGLKAFNERMSAPIDPKDIGGDFTKGQKRLIAQSANKVINDYKSLVEQYDENIKKIADTMYYKGVPLDNFEKEFKNLNSYAVARGTLAQETKTLQKEISNMIDKAEMVKQEIYKDPVRMELPDPKSKLFVQEEQAPSDDKSVKTGLTSPAGLST